MLRVTSHKTNKRSISASYPNKHCNFTTTQAHAVSLYLESLWTHDNVGHVWSLDAVWPVVTFQLRLKGFPSPSLLTWTCPPPPYSLQLNLVVTLSCNPTLRDTNANTYCTLARQIPLPPLRDPAVSEKPLWQSGKSSAWVQAPPKNRAVHHQITPLQRWKLNGAFVCGKVWQSNVSISNQTHDYAESVKICSAAASSWPLHFIPPFITFVLSRQRIAKQKKRAGFPLDRNSTQPLKICSVCALEGSWPHFLSHSQWYVVRGTSCAHFKRRPPGEPRLTCKHTQKQQSPPNPHPINQPCSDIIVKQARSLLEDGRCEEWP